jgi:mono/diheme cytochrome c family protein
VLLLLLLLAVAGGLLVWYTMTTGLSEGEVIADGRAHFADHCAVCHANDGSGDTEMRRGMWPKPPRHAVACDAKSLRRELFWIIENGIRFTGMPGWGTGTKEGAEDSCHRVHFIRRLPKLTPEQIAEMEALDPKSPDEIRQQLEEGIPHRRRQGAARRRCTSQAPRRTQ